MEIGKLNRRITLKTVTRTPDGIGGFTETEVSQKETWGSVKPMSQREQLLYGLEVGVRAYKCAIRFDVNFDIDQSYFIEYVNRFSDTVKFRVIQVLNMDESTRKVELAVTERTD